MKGYEQDESCGESFNNDVQKKMKLLDIIYIQWSLVTL
jgi:hypothetical protein